MPEATSDAATRAKTATRSVAGTARDGIDGVIPTEVITPQAAEEIPDILRESCRLGHTVVARGSGTRLDLGNPPARVDRLISLHDIDRIVEHAPDDMVVIVDAGTTVSALERHLATAGQRSGLGAWDPVRATVGGVVAANEHSDRAYAFGGPRDQVLGLDVVDGCGRVLRCGGRVVKNVAGYDLPRLFVGSLGTLGIITRLTLRTHPLPEAGEELEMRSSDPAAIAQVAADLFRSRLPLSTLRVHGFVEQDRHGGDCRMAWQLLAGIEGTPEQVRSMKGTIAKAATMDVQSVRDAVGQTAPRADENLVLRATVLPSDAVDIAARWLSRARDVAKTARVLIDFPGVVVRLIAQVPSFEIANRVIEAVTSDSSASDGTVLERLPLGAKTGRDVWGEAPAGLDIMRRVKARFDPDRVLARGRFVGHI